MQRSAAASLGVVGVAALAAIAWYALRGPEAPPPVPVDEPPVSQPMDVAKQREIQHLRPWPYGDFAGDIEALQKIDPEAGELAPEEVRRQNELAIMITKFPIAVRDGTPDDVIRAIQTHFKDSGVKIFTKDVPLPDDLRVTVVGDELTIPEAVYRMTEQTGGIMKLYMTWQGLCIGPEAALQMAQMEADAAAGELRSRRDREAAVLSAEYRPGLERAWIGDIVKDIRAQTGVEVVVDAELWSRPKTMSWRAKPMPLRDALDRIAREIGGFYRVRDDRVFLLRP